MQNNFTRMMIEVAVDKALVEIKRKSKRALRNLADLGLRYAKGRFQDNFFTIAHHMLEDDNSPYYDMFFHLANDVDPNMLKKFGINLGYNSWTTGAKTIRKWEQENGYHVPWTVVFDWETSRTDQLLGRQEIQENIFQAKEMGVYCYMFFVGENAKTFHELLDVFEKNDDCAFLCFCEAPLITPQIAARLRKMGNAMPIIDISKQKKEQTVNACRILLAEKCLFSLSVVYDDKNTASIIEEYNKTGDRSLCAFLFLMKKQGCSDKVAAQMHEFVDESQENPQNTLFPIDFYEDISHVDRTISKENCYLEIKAKDKALFGTKIVQFNKDLNFRALLQTYMPKTQWE